MDRLSILCLFPLLCHATVRHLKNIHNSKYNNISRKKNREQNSFDFFSLFNFITYTQTFGSWHDFSIMIWISSRFTILLNTFLSCFFSLLYWFKVVFHVALTRSVLLIPGAENLLFWLKECAFATPSFIYALKDEKQSRWNWFLLFCLFHKCRISLVRFGSVCWIILSRHITRFWKPISVDHMKK